MNMTFVLENSYRHVDYIMLHVLILLQIPQIHRRFDHSFFPLLYFVLWVLVHRVR